MKSTQEFADYLKPLTFNGFFNLLQVSFFVFIFISFRERSSTKKRKRKKGATGSSETKSKIE